MECNASKGWCKYFIFLLMIGLGSYRSRLGLVLGRNILILCFICRLIRIQRLWKLLFLSFCFLNLLIGFDHNNSIFRIIKWIMQFRIKQVVNHFVLLIINQHDYNITQNLENIWATFLWLKKKGLLEFKS